MEREALLASGVKEKDRVLSYMVKLDHLQRQFIHEINPTSDPVVRARALFTWLWIEKPNRYRANGYFCLNDVIDAHINKGSQSVGNCLGLTLLFNCLLRRIDVKADALSIENVFGVASHVLTLLQTKDLSIDIENILPDGFDHKGHLSNALRKRWRDKELVAAIYHRVGNENSEKGNWAKALKNYEMSIQLNPNNERSYLDKAVALGKMGRVRRQSKKSS